MWRILTRIIGLSVAGCPGLRPDPGHHDPGHRIWECKEADKSRRRGALLEAWLNGEVSSGELLEIIGMELERGRRAGRGGS